MGSSRRFSLSVGFLRAGVLSVRFFGGQAPPPLGDRCYENRLWRHPAGSPSVDVVSDSVSLRAAWARADPLIAGRSPFRRVRPCVSVCAVWPATRQQHETVRPGRGWRCNIALDEQADASSCRVRWLQSYRAAETDSRRLNTSLTAFASAAELIRGRCLGSSASSTGRRWEATRIPPPGGPVRSRTQRSVTTSGLDAKRPSTMKSALLAESRRRLRPGTPRPGPRWPPSAHLPRPPRPAARRSLAASCCPSPGA